MELTKENVALIAAVGLLVGTLITNFISLLIHFSKERTEKQKQRKDRLRLKGEELFKVILLHKEFCCLSHLDWVKVIDKTITYSQMCDFAKNRSGGDPEKKDYAVKMDFIGGIYFPRTRERLAQAQAGMRIANQYYFLLHDLSKIKDPSKAITIILDASEKYSQNIDDILNELAMEIRSL
ncbi:hypothetical protein [Enterobacter roggenkampii]|uniref:hypothetical protein n=1 Tax=Enterobacter roggenkampii TaxID=1812935 RepID=UPI000614F7E2|nr:hypothetical protein [Enterobacter roggenkampii]KKA57615.1 hypothetical protein UP01_04130 [Enterobacter roggenkampii]